MGLVSARPVQVDVDVWQLGYPTSFPHHGHL